MHIHLLSTGTPTLSLKRMSCGYLIEVAGDILHSTTDPALITA